MTCVGNKSFPCKSQVISLQVQVKSQVISLQVQVKSQVTKIVTRVRLESKSHDSSQHLCGILVCMSRICRKDPRFLSTEMPILRLGCGGLSRCTLPIHDLTALGHRLHPFKVESTIFEKGYSPMLTPSTAYTIFSIICRGRSRNS